jgi:hypothetical protein
MAYVECAGLTGKSPSLPFLEILVNAASRIENLAARIGAEPNGVDRGATIFADKQLNVRQKFLTNLSAQHMRNPSTGSHGGTRQMNRR